MKHSQLPSRDLDRYAVRAVDRALDLVEVLRDVARPLGLQDISQRLRMAKSSCFRLLCTLERRGYVERVEIDGRAGYVLGTTWLSYCDATTNSQPLAEVALPHMRRLLEAYGETVNLGVLRDGEVLYLEMLESHHSFRMAARIGTRSPMHSTALGKAIAAYLPNDDLEAIIGLRGLYPLTPRTITSRIAWQRELARTKVRGYAEDNSETEPGASCIGAPIFGSDGQVVGGISISGPESRMRVIKPRAVRSLIEACQAISRALGCNTRTALTTGG
jgi:IclR family acetate operon transcriptional repressor